MSEILVAALAEGADQCWLTYHDRRTLHADQKASSVTRERPDLDHELWPQRWLTVVSPQMGNPRRSFASGHVQQIATIVKASNQVPKRHGQHVRQHADTCIPEERRRAPQPMETGSDHSSRGGPTTLPAEHVGAGYIACPTTGTEATKNAWQLGTRTLLNSYGNPIRATTRS